MWDTRATRLCDTLTWFPTKTPMPLASSNDLILAGIKDIVTALHNPTAGSPFPPLADSHHKALTELTSLLTGILPAPATESQPDSPLRVATTAPAPMSHPPLRVLAAPPRTKSVSFAPLPAPVTGDTFVNSTGVPGQKRRRIRRQSLASSAVRPAKTVHPKKLLAPIALPRIVAKHPHGTRSKHLQHVAACARALIFDDARARQSPFARNPAHMHFAYLGHAINPDTGKIENIAN